MLHFHSLIPLHQAFSVRVGAIFFCAVLFAACDMAGPDPDESLQVSVLPNNGAVSELSLSLVDGRLAFRSIEDLDRYAAAIAGRDASFLDWIDESIGFVSLRSHAEQDADPKAELAVAKWGDAISAVFNSASEIQVSGQVYRLPEAGRAGMNEAFAGIVESISAHEISHARSSGRGSLDHNASGAALNKASRRFTHTDTCQRGFVDGDVEFRIAGQASVINDAGMAGVVLTTQVIKLDSGQWKPYHGAVRSVFIRGYSGLELVNGEGTVIETLGGSGYESADDGRTILIGIYLAYPPDGEQWSIQGSLAGSFGADVEIYDGFLQTALGADSWDESCEIFLSVP